jgi:hypothetical protein
MISLIVEKRSSNLVGQKHLPPHMIQLSGLWYLTLALPCQKRSASARNSLLGSLLLMLIINVRIANPDINRVADIKTYLKLTHPTGNSAFKTSKD